MKQEFCAKNACSLSHAIKSHSLLKSICCITELNVFVLALQDKQDKNHLKGDFVFHTEHVVELVAKLLVQVESQNDLSAPVHVSDKYADSL